MSPKVKTFLQVSNICFDASTQEIWVSLLNGYKLVIFSGNVLSLQDIANTIKNENVDSIVFPTGLFHQVVDYHLTDLANVKQIIVGGDILSISHSKNAVEQLPNTRLINGYGPTENTTITTFNEVVAEDLKLSTIPIGKVVSNTSVYILDEELQPVPIGVVGELYTAGDGLARGYIQNADLTAERFLPNPFSLEPGARMYRTGDLARWLSNGKIEFLGRRDNQVKVRGFRIELEEIEIAISKHPQVQDCAVMIEQISSENLSHNKQIVAYFSGSAEETVLLDHFKALLPEYMLPNHIIKLERMPLTPNGKIDRRALTSQTLISKTFKVTSNYKAARNTLETSLVAIWENILNTKPIGIEENFFSLGGHSLLVVKMLSEIRKLLGKDLEVVKMFQHPTIKELAQLLEETRQENNQSPLVLLNKAKTTRNLYCVHPIGGQVSCYINLAEALAENVNFYAFQAPGLNSLETTLESIPELANAYVNHLKNQNGMPYLLAGWSFGGLVAYEMAQQLIKKGEQVEAVILFDSWASLCGKVIDKSSSTILGDFAYDVLRSKGVLPTVSIQEFEKLTFEEQKIEIIKECIKTGILTEDSSWKDLEGFWKVYKANKLALYSYHPVPAKFKLILLKALNQTTPNEDPYLGWGSLGNVELFSLPVDHYSILSKGFLHFSVDLLKQYFEKNNKVW